MPDFQPFAALRFAHGLYARLPDLVAPPCFDLDRKATQKLRESHPHHIYNLLFPGQTQTRRGLLEAWIEQGVLVSDENPALYVYRQEFELGEELHHRTGWFGAMSLAHSDPGDIFAHAHSNPEATEPLERQMRECSAHLETVTMLTADPQGRLAQLSSFASMNAPLVTFVDPNRIEHSLWRVDDTTTLNEVGALITSNPLVIVDGDVPFEAAQRAAREGLETPLPVLVVPAHEPSLMLLPVHRGLRGFKPEDVLKRLEGHFEITRWTRTLPELLTHLSGETERFLLGLGLGRGFYLASAPASTPRPLDVVVLHELVLEKLLGLEAKALNPGEALDYFDDPDEAHELLDQEQLSVAFFLPPPQVEQIMASTLAGKRLPRRSLNLYPRVPMGLIMTSRDSLKSAGELKPQ
ncbi:MAG: DUF1015 family protein [Vulcanimicrobiota bacterium]